MSQSDKIELLTPPPVGWESQPKQLRSVAPLSQKRNFEPFGSSYLNKLLAQNGGARAPVALLSQEELEAAKVIHEDPTWAALRAKYDLKNSYDIDNYYSVLGVDENVTPEAITALWKTLSVICHPDKAPNNLRDKAEKRFQAMQRGVTVICDPVQRRAFDSKLPFDDDIPDTAGPPTKPDQFFAVYGPVFARNARFSVVQPVPSLGDMNTSYEDMDKFYDFWFSFKSWRDFSELDSHQTASADSRDEKRWMQKENEKKKVAAKKAEAARVRQLVDNAEARDPRVARRKKEVEEEKERRKREKNAGKIKAAEEAAAAEAERLRAIEAAKAAEAATAEQKKREKEQQDAVKKTRKTFKRISKTFHVLVSDEQLDLVLDALDFDRMQALIDLLGKNPLASEELGGPTPAQRKEAFNAFHQIRVAKIGEEAAAKLLESEAAAAVERDQQAAILKAAQAEAEARAAKILEAKAKVEAEKRAKIEAELQAKKEAEEKKKEEARLAKIESAAKEAAKAAKKQAEKEKKAEKERAAKAAEDQKKAEAAAAEAAKAGAEKAKVAVVAEANNAKKAEEAKASAEAEAAAAEEARKKARKAAKKERLKAEKEKARAAGGPVPADEDDEDEPVPAAAAVTPAPALAAAAAEPAAEKTGAVEWSKAEHERLEVLMRTHPESTEDRWNRIADAMGGGKTGKQVMKYWQKSKRGTEAPHASHTKHQQQPHANHANNKPLNQPRARGGQ